MSLLLESVVESKVPEMARLDTEDQINLINRYAEEHQLLADLTTLEIQIEVDPAQSVTLTEKEER